MIRLLPLTLVLVLAVAVAARVIRFLGERTAARGRLRRTAKGPGRYEFERRRDQARRRLKGVGGAPERRDEIIAFLDAHRGVEAYIEPKTAMSPLSVALVDENGDWRRFELADDRFIRRLASERHVQVLDAAQTGYPKRMKRTGHGSEGG